jgi:hypothetical protein
MKVMDLGKGERTQAMNVLFCRTEASIAAVAPLERMVEAVVPEGSLRKDSRIGDLSRRLRDPAETGEIAILAAASRQELQEFIALEELLEGLRIILILPDREARTVSEGHKLRPRLWTHLDDDFSVLRAVLEKMIKTDAQQIQGEKMIMI